MSENTAVIFDDYKKMMGLRLKKNEYEAHMKLFREKYMHIFRAALAEAAEGKAAAEAFAEAFAENAHERFAKRGRVGGAVTANLNMFMICYLFPAILLEEDAAGTLLCDSIRDAWNKKFGEHINYTDYDTIYRGFNDKIFGIF